MAISVISAQRQDRSDSPGLRGPCVHQHVLCADWRWSVLEPTARGSSESAWVLPTAQYSALYRVEMQLGQKPGLGGD